MSASETDTEPAASVRRPCLALFAAYAAGLLLWRWAPFPEGASPAAPLAGVAALAVLSAAFWRRPWARGAALVVLAAAGYLWASHLGRPGAGDIARLLPSGPTPLRLEGRILSADLPPPAAPAGAGRDVRMVLAVDTVRGEGYCRDVTGRTRVTFRGEEVPDLTPGDRVRLLATVSRPRRATVPGSFDYSEYLAGRRIFSTASSPGGTALTLVDAASLWSPRAAIHRARRAVVTMLRSTLSPGNAALMAALLVGEKQELPRSELEEYYRSGVGHIFAVSGLHVSLVAGAMWLVLTHAGVRRRRAAVAVAAAVVLYAALAGGRTPAVRAAVMTVAFVGAVLAGREADPVNVLSFAGLAILAWRPAELYSAGFALSFTAVLFITLLYGRLEGWWERRLGLPPELLRGAERRLPDLVLRWMRRSLWVSLSAYLGLWPLVLYHFGYVVLWSVPVNTFVVPWLWVVLCAGLFLVAVGTVSSGLALLLAPAAGALLGVLRAMVELAGRLPASPVYLPRPHPGWIVLYYALWAATLTRARWRPRGRVVPAAWLVAVNLFLASVLVVGAPASSRVDFLDLGSADSTVIRPAGGGTILVDAGSSWERPAALDFLAAQGMGRIDVLVITRDDAESLSAVPELLRRVSVGRVLVPSSADRSPDLSRIETACRAMGIPIERPHSGDSADLGGAVLEILGPAPPTSMAAAAQTPRPPTVLRVTLSEGLRILFASASAPEDVRPLTRLEPSALRADVVRFSCSYYQPSRRGGVPVLRDLLALGRPRIAVVARASYERTNPGPEALSELLRERRMREVGTDEFGTVRLRICPGGRAVISGYRGGEWKRIDAFQAGPPRYAAPPPPPPLP